MYLIMLDNTVNHHHHHQQSNLIIELNVQFNDLENYTFSLYFIFSSHSIYFHLFFHELFFAPKKKDKRAKKLLQFCSVCEGYKAPRSHHCRKCGRCVMKMDHHCPWLNTVHEIVYFFKWIIVYFSFLNKFSFSFLFFANLIDIEIYPFVQCVGWNNHAYFTSFLAFSVLGCIQSTFILGASIYRGIHYSW